MATKKGRVHVVTTPGNDRKNSKCGVVKANHRMPVASGGWGKRKGLSPDAALALLDCAKCNTHEIAEVQRRAQMTPAQKRAEAKAKAQDTRDHLKTGKVKRPKAKKEPKQRRGPKGGDAAARMKANVETHLALAEENGWKGKAWESDTSEWRVEVKRNGELLRLIYRDGRTVHSRVTLKNGVEVRLRNSSNWRKHATGKSGIKPDYAPKRTGKKKSRTEESVEHSSPKELPFNLDMDDHDTIIESLLGKTITWRMTISKSLDSAKVPTRSRNCRITVHPKSNRKMISFHESQGMGEHGEMLGGERVVYLDKILKAR
jgi:hypothetical protein